MAQVKTSELTGVALDWAVLYANTYRATGGKPILTRDLMQSAMRNGMAYPSTDWAQGGPIIEREKICACPSDYPVGSPWNATDNTGYITHFGPNPLIAAMRCHVSSKLGNVVEVPDELIK